MPPYFWGLSISNKYYFFCLLSEVNPSRYQYFPYLPHCHFWQGGKSTAGWKDAIIKMSKNKNLSLNPDPCRASLVQFTLSQFITSHHCSLFITHLQSVWTCFYPSQHVLVICVCFGKMVSKGLLKCRFYTTCLSSAYFVILSER